MHPGTEMKGVCTVDTETVVASAPCAPPTSDTGSCSGSGSDLGSFLTSWKANIQPKFIPLLSALSQTDAARNLLLCQVCCCSMFLLASFNQLVTQSLQIYTYLPVLTQGKQTLQSENICLLGTRVLDEFHQDCHSSGIPLDLIGPMGKVWENGDVQVVQYPANLPTNVYPMDRFPQNAVPVLGELVFLPLYDSKPNSSTQGIVGVIELMLNKNTTDAMVVATMISTIATIMHDLGLSLSTPSTAPSSCDSASTTMERTGSLVSNNSAWKASSKEKVGMSRRASQHNLT
jgi:hypothetical protein